MTWPHRTLPTLGVVIPTRGRRDKICSLVRRLQEQHFDDNRLQIIVVLDGDIDGTGAALAALTVRRVPVPVVLGQTGDDPQVGHGAGPARNAGVASATGDVVLFLDDDVVPIGDDLLLQHAQGHRRDAPCVLVGVTVARPSAPSAYLSRAISDWWQKQTRHFEAGHALRFTDITTANLSLPTRLFRDIRGFRALSRREDWDLGLRLQTSHVPLIPLAGARVDHTVDTDVCTYLADVRREGAGDAEMAEAHPMAVGALPLDLYRHITAVGAVLLRQAFLQRGTDVGARGGAAVLDALERTRREYAWRATLRRATLLQYWAGVGDALASLERLHNLLRRADEAALSSLACFDIASGELRLPTLDEACEVRVVRGAVTLGTAPLRWGGLPFDEDLFKRQVRSRFTRPSLPRAWPVDGRWSG
jgi:GT2 family glycosyltransferase